MSTTPPWAFRARFRKNAFGWRSQPAVKRIKEATTEIKKAARHDPVLAAEGAVLFFEKLSPALTNIDSSSGSIGSAVGKAIDALAPLIAAAPAEVTTRERWLERLWQAHLDDEMPYIEHLSDYWGAMCASADIASHWADRLLGPLREAWSPEREAGQRYFAGTSQCLGALLAAGRHAELLDLLKTAPFTWWHYHQWGVRALAALGKPDEALDYAEAARGRSDSPGVIAATCEEVLIACGRPEEAYTRYGLLANERGTYLAWFRAVSRKYPDKQPAEILADLVAQSPGEEGKWFAAAKSAGLFDEAITLARRTPGSPQTLTRAARDFEQTNPTFAIEAGMAALRWLSLGYGYEHTMAAAEHAGCVEATKERIRVLVAKETLAERFAPRILRRKLGLS